MSIKFILKKAQEEDGFVKYRKSIAHINNSVSFERIGYHIMILILSLQINFQNL